MELSTFQRFVAFAAVVIVLAGLGVYLFLPSGSGNAAPGAGRSTPPGQPSSPVPSSPSGPSGSAPPGQPTSIYQWLPFTAAGLASAANVAVEFGTDYATFSYSQNTAAYLAPMQPLITSQLDQLLGRAYSAPGLAAARTSQKQVSTGSAVISSLRAFGPSSLTFVMVITERITDSKGSSQRATDYAVTLTGSGTSWQVSDIELASAGNL